MMKLAEQKNLQSITGEYGEIENQEAIDAAKEYNTSEQSRFLQQNYGNEKIEDIRRMNAERGIERSKVIEMQRAMQNSVGGTTDTGFTQTMISAPYTPKEYKVETPKFQALPNPQFQKATISRFNPNAGGSGGAKAKSGTYPFNNPDGSIVGAQQRQLIKQWLGKVKKAKFDNITIMDAAFEAGSNYAIKDKASMLADNYDIFDKTGVYKQGDFYSSSVSGTTAVMQKAFDAGWSNLSSVSQVPEADRNDFQYYKKLKLDTPQALLTLVKRTVNGQEHNGETLGQGFSTKYGEGVDNVINSQYLFAIHRKDGTDGTKREHYQMQTDYHPAWADLVEAKAEKELAKINASPAKYEKYMADFDAHNLSIDKSQAERREDYAQHLATTYLKQQYGFTNPSYIDDLLIQKAMAGELKVGETYAYAPEEVYLTSGFLKGASGQSTSHLKSGVRSKYDMRGETFYNSKTVSPFSVVGKFTYIK